MGNANTAKQKTYSLSSAVYKEEKSERTVINFDDNSNINNSGRQFDYLNVS